MSDFKMVVGDLASDAKGSGARANGGKPDMSLIPVRLIAETTACGPNGVGQVLYTIAAWQERRGDIPNALDLAVTAAGGWDSCARAFEYGRRKYAAWNWAKGMAWSVPLACAVRHLLAIAAGEQDDPESGFPHWGHVVCNLVMLTTYASTYPEGDDRPAAGLLSPAPDRS